MADYLEFVNLWQADDEEIARFLEKNGPLGFDIFNSWEFSDKGIRDMMFRDKWAIDEIKESFFTHKPAQFPVAEEFRSRCRIENPYNIRYEAGCLRDSLMLYHLIMDFRRPHDRIKFLEAYSEDLLERSVGAEFAEDIKKLWFDGIDKKQTMRAAVLLVTDFESRLFNSFKAALAVTSLTVKRGRDGYIMDYAPSCPIADFWFQGIRDVLSEKLTPVICDRCGKMFMSARQWGKSCPLCRKAAKARRNRERKAEQKGLTVRSGPGRPPKQK